MSTKRGTGILGRCIIIILLLSIANIICNVLLLSNEGSYSSLNTVTITNTISKSITWDALNKQQFCSINSDSDQQHKFFVDLHKQQYTVDCDDRSTQFLIYDISLQTGSGLGASLFGNLVRYFFVSMQLNRTFLIHGHFDWTQDAIYCNGSNAMECYFLPLSHCDPLYIMSNTNSYYEGAAPTNCLFNEKSYSKTHLIHCTERVIYINKASRGFIATWGFIEKWTRRYYQLPVIEYQAIVSAFILRPQPHITDIIHLKIDRSIHKSLGVVPSVLNASRMVAMPIRASDKCRNSINITNKEYTHQAEIQCFTPLEHVQLMNVIKYFDDEINTVILTSEDAEFVQNVIDIMNVSQWNIIQNTEDYSVGEGTTTYKNTIKKYGNILDDKLGSSLYTDPIVSALSSLMLQLHLETKYMVYIDSSTWTKLLWRWRSILNCNANKQLHRSQHKCILLQAPGYMHLTKDYKTIVLSSDLQREVKRRKMTEKQLLKRFGINVKLQKGCESVSISNPRS